MTGSRLAWLMAGIILAAGAAALAQDRVGGATDPSMSSLKAELASANSDGEIARKRAEQLETEARAITARADKTAHEAAALAARIQESEAQVAAQEARAGLISKDREALRARLAERQAPLLRLTASLQRLARRPPLLALLRPGSVRDAVYTRALFDTMLPEVQRRTLSLRSEIEQGRKLEAKALVAARDLRAGEQQLQAKRKELAQLEAGQRIASRNASGVAAREADRALALAEKARDIGDLMGEVSKQGDLREQLAALPGPIMRPPRPEESQVLDASSFVPPPQGLSDYILPLTGQVLTGFGEQPQGSVAGQARSRGLTLQARPNAQAVAPAPGRVAYAGTYRGYGQIVIIEHPGGWTSLVTGLARLDVAVGDEVVAGSPLGMTGPGEPKVSLELRHDGEPVNPLQYVRPL